MVTEHDPHLLVLRMDVSGMAHQREVILTLSLYWRPLVPQEKKSLPYELKYAISRRWFGHDGSLKGSAITDEDSIHYLNGLADANVKGAKELIEAINQYGEVEVIIE